MNSIEEEWLYSLKRGDTFLLPEKMAQDFMQYMNSKGFIYTYKSKEEGIAYTEIQIDVVPKKENK